MTKIRAKFHKPKIVNEQKKKLSNILLSKYLQGTSHKQYTAHGILVGNLFFAEHDFSVFTHCDSSPLRDGATYYFITLRFGFGSTGDHFHNFP